jgi:hypothetical protein
MYIILYNSKGVIETEVDSSAGDGYAPEPVCWFA